MKFFNHTLTIATKGRGGVDISGSIKHALTGCGIQQGLLTVFIRHTSASLLIQENADPDVLKDLMNYLLRLAPDGDPRFDHRSEGPDDMAAHIRTALTQTHLSIPWIDGDWTLGTWQGVFLLEHRLAPHRRQVVLQLMGM